MKYDIECIADTVVVRLSGDIDHHEAKSVREAIDDAVTRSGAAQLELDFGDVSFMDSSGIGLVMGRYKLMEEIGGTLHVTNIAGHLKKVMLIAGLDQIFQVEQGGRRFRAKKRTEKSASKYRGVQLLSEEAEFEKDPEPEDDAQVPDLNELCRAAARRAADTKGTVVTAGGKTYRGVPLITDEPSNESGGHRGREG